MIHHVDSAWSISFACLSNTHLPSSMPSLTPANRLAGIASQPMPSTRPSARPASPEKAGRKQLTNDGCDVQWRTRAAFSKPSQSVNALTAYYIGWIVLLFPSPGLVQIRWKKTKLAKPLSSWLSSCCLGALSAAPLPFPVHTRHSRAVQHLHTSIRRQHTATLS